jgi:DnaJ-class molecular chaperone
MDDFLSDILGQAFGGKRARPGAGPAGGARPDGFGTGRSNMMKGDDVQITADISLEEVIAEGKVRVSLPTGKTLDVQLPEGAINGQQIRLKGQGLPGSPAGDAIVTLAFRPHPQFRAEGSDLWLDLAVSLEDAVLGGKVRVPTLEGAVDVTIPAGTTGGKAMRLRNKGLPQKGGTRGDLYVTPRITLPDAGDVELEAFLRMRKQR